MEIRDPDSPLAGAKIDVPPNALTNSTTLSIQESNNAEAPPIETFPAGEVISFLPDGTIFNEAVTISLPYHDDDHDGYIDGTSVSEENIHAMVFNTQSNLWQDIRVTGIDVENVKIYGKGLTWR